MLLFTGTCTVTGMELEYEQAYRHLRTSGILIPDDAPLDSALFECACNVARLSARAICGVDVLQKPDQ
jgi:hypothetical protein